MAKSNVDPVGRKVGEDAQAAYDAKLYAPAENLASDEKIAQRAGKHVANFLSTAEHTRTFLLEKMAVFYAMWNGEPISRYYPSARSVHVPEPYKAVESVVGRLFDILLGPSKWFRVVGLDDGGRKNAEVVTNLILEQLRQDGFRRKAVSMFRDTCIYGWKVAKLRWKTCRRKIKYNKLEEEDILEAGTKTGKEVSVKRGEVQEVNLDGPTVEPVDNMDVYVDIRFHDLQDDAPGLALRQEVFEEALLEDKEAGWYKNVDEIMKEPFEHKGDSQVAGPQGTAIQPSTYKQMRDYSDGIHIDFVSTSPASRRYEIYEFYGKFDPKQDMGSLAKSSYANPVRGKGKQEEYIITLGRKLGQHGDLSQSGAWTVLRVVKNSWWHGKRPIVDAHYTRRSHSFHSVGLIEPIVKLCLELDDSRNMALAARALAVKPIVIATDQADIYSNNMILDPGTVIRARTVDAVKFTAIPDRSDAAYKAEEAIKRDIHETTGVVTIQMGSDRGGAETATGTVSRLREANKRLSEAARNISENMLIPMLEQIFSMNQQMITEERMIEMLGEDGLVTDVRKVGPADVAGRVRFEILAMPQIEMAGIQGQMLSRFASNAMPLWQLMPDAINMPKLMEKIWEKEFGSKDIPEIFPNSQVPKEMRTTYQEHQLIAYGQVLKPQRGENLQAHMAGHLGFIKTSAFQGWAEDAKRRLIAHIENTKIAFQDFVEQQVIPQMPPQMAQLPAGPQGPGGPPQGAGGPPGGAPPQGAQPTPTGQVRSSIASIEPRMPGGGE